MSDTNIETGIKPMELQDALKEGEASVVKYLRMNPSTKTEYQRHELVSRSQQAMEVLRKHLFSAAKEEKMVLIRATQKVLEKEKFDIQTDIRKTADQNLHALRDKIENARLDTVNEERKISTTTEQVVLEGKEVATELMDAKDKEGGWKTWAKYLAAAGVGIAAAKWLWDHTGGWLLSKTIGTAENPGFIRRMFQGAAIGLGAIGAAIGLKAFMNSPYKKIAEGTAEAAKEGYEGANKKVFAPLLRNTKEIYERGNMAEVEKKRLEGKYGSEAEYHREWYEALAKDGFHYVWSSGGVHLINAEKVLFVDAFDFGKNALNVLANLRDGDAWFELVRLEVEGTLVYASSLGALETIVKTGTKGPLGALKDGMKHSATWQIQIFKQGVGVLRIPFSYEGKTMAVSSLKELGHSLPFKWNRMKNFVSNPSTIEQFHALHQEFEFWNGIHRDTKFLQSGKEISARAASRYQRVLNNMQTNLFEMGKRSANGKVLANFPVELERQLEEALRKNNKNAIKMEMLEKWLEQGTPERLRIINPVAEAISNGKTSAQLLSEGKDIRGIVSSLAELDDTAGARIMTELLHAGKTMDELLEAGADASHLLKAGQSADRVASALLKLPRDTRVAGISSLIGRGASAKDILAAGISPSDILRAGAEPAEMMKLGATAEDFVRADLSLKDFVKAGGNANAYKSIAQGVRAEIAMAETPAVKTMLTRLAAGKLSPAELKNLEQAIKNSVKPGLIEAFTPGSRAEKLLISAAKSPNAEKEVARIFRAAEKASTAGKVVTAGGALFEAALLYFDYQEYKEKAEHTDNEELKQLYKQSFVLKASQTATTVIGVSIGGGAAAWMMGGTFMAGAVAPAGAVLLPVAAAAYGFRAAQKNLEYAAEFYLMDDKQLKEFSPGKLLAQVDEYTPGTLASWYPKWLGAPTVEELKGAKNAANVNRIWVYLGKRAETLFPVMPGLPREVEQETFEYRRTFVLDTFNYLRALQEGKPDDKKYFGMNPSDFAEAEAYAKMNAGLRQNGKPFDQSKLSDANTMKTLKSSLADAMHDGDEATMNFLSQVSQNPDEFLRSGPAMMMRLLTHDMACADKNIMNYNYKTWSSGKAWSHWADEAEMQAVVRGVVADQLWQSMKKIVTSGPMTAEQVRTTMKSLREQLAYLPSLDSLAERTEDKDWGWQKNIGGNAALLTPEGMQWYMHRYPLVAVKEAADQDVIDIHGLQFYSKDKRATLTLKGAKEAHISGIRGWKRATLQKQSSVQEMDKDIETFAPGTYVLWQADHRAQRPLSFMLPNFEHDMILEIKA